MKRGFSAVASTATFGHVKKKIKSKQAGKVRALVTGGGWPSTTSTFAFHTPASAQRSDARPTSCIPPPPLCNPPLFLLCPKYPQLLVEVIFVPFLPIDTSTPVPAPLQTDEHVLKAHERPEMVHLVEEEELGEGEGEGEGDGEAAGGHHATGAASSGAPEAAVPAPAAMAGGGAHPEHRPAEQLPEPTEATPAPASADTHAAASAHAAKVSGKASSKKKEKPPPPPPKPTKAELDEIAYGQVMAHLSATIPQHWGHWEPSHGDSAHEKKSSLPPPGVLCLRTLRAELRANPSWHDRPEPWVEYSLGKEKRHTKQSAGLNPTWNEARHRLTAQRWRSASRATASPFLLPSVSLSSAHDPGGLPGSCPLPQYLEFFQFHVTDTTYLQAVVHYGKVHHGAVAAVDNAAGAIASAIGSTISFATKARRGRWVGAGRAGSAGRRAAGRLSSAESLLWNGELRCRGSGPCTREGYWCTRNRTPNPRFYPRRLPPTPPRRWERSGRWRSTSTRRKGTCSTRKAGTSGATQTPRRPISTPISSSIRASRGGRGCRSWCVGERREVEAEAGRSGPAENAREN